jgi:hypothetical protein
VIAGPALSETILLADVSLEAAAAKAVCDVAGHYARPDVFPVRVDGEPIGRTVARHAEAAGQAETSRHRRERETLAGPNGLTGGAHRSATPPRPTMSLWPDVTSSTRPSTGTRLPWRRLDHDRRVADLAA